jgi:hypothetical protein
MCMLQRLGLIAVETSAPTLRTAAPLPACMHHAPPTAPSTTTNPTERASTCSAGVEVPTQLVWTNWEPGGEYTRALTIKNVSSKVVTVVHRPNHSKAFCLEYPEAVKLSPGMSTALRVTFRPLRAMHYVDAVEISCDGAPVAVPLAAPLAAPRVAAPAAVDFGLVPAREVFSRPLPLANAGGAAVAFVWRVGAPFSVVPAAGRLAAGRAAACQVVFAPEEAAAFAGTAACELDNGEVVVVQVSSSRGSRSSRRRKSCWASRSALASNCSLLVCYHYNSPPPSSLSYDTIAASLARQLAGAAKLPYLTLESKSLDLGRVAVGRSASVQLRVGNHSPVAAKFTVAAEDAAGAAGLPGGGGAAGADERVFEVTPSE